MGIVHWHAEIRRKWLILCTESSKKLTQIVTFSAPNVLDPLPTLNLHLIINNDLLWDHKIQNLRDLEIIKGVGLVLRPTTLQYFVQKILLEQFCMLFYNLYYRADFVVEMKACPSFCQYTTHWQSIRSSRYMTDCIIVI